MTNQPNTTLPIASPLTLRTLHSNQNIGERIKARRTRCGSRNMQITQEFIASENYEVRAGRISSVTPAASFKATGRLLGHCRQRGHDWVFRKNPLAS